MTEETEDALMRMIRTLLANQVEQAGRLDGLLLTLGVVASRCGVDPVEFEGMVLRSSETCHQARLEEIEKRNPAMAALLDLRREAPEIDEALLRAVEYLHPDQRPPQ